LAINESMKNGNFGLIVFLSLGLLLTSCEGNTDRDWIIANDSSSSIEVTATFILDSGMSKETINSGNSKTITITNQLGGNSTPQAPNEVFTSLLVTNEEGGTFTRDFTLLENWESTIEQTKRVPSNYVHEYILYVTNEDF